MGLQIAMFPWYSLPKHQPLPQGGKTVVGTTVKATNEKAEQERHENGIYFKRV